jgi:proton glutamate symport protein
MLQSLSVRVLLALAVGLALGAAAAAFGGEGVKPLVGGVEAAGQLWLNALRMTVVPLIFSVMVTGVAGVADAASTGRLAVKALTWFLSLLIAAAVISLLLSHALYAVWPLSEGAAGALRAGAQAPPAQGQAAGGFVDFLKTLAPPNPFKAAVEGNIPQLVVFAAVLGLAVTRLPEATRRPLTDLFDALVQAMVVIVRWVLAAAPIGVFALALGVGQRAGVGAAGAIARYTATVSVIVALVGLSAYAIAVLVGRVPLRRWARAVGPVQVTAFATQSSLACLPAMIERAKVNLGVPDRVSGLVLPLAVSIFRLSSPAANMAVAMFVANVYGLHPAPTQYAAAVLMALVVSIGGVGLPNQANFLVANVPICMAFGLPLDVLPILLAVEVIPDMFRTVTTVTGDMAVTAILGRGERAATAAAALPQRRAA